MNRNHSLNWTGCYLRRERDLVWLRMMKEAISAFIQLNATTWENWNGTHWNLLSRFVRFLDRKQKLCGILLVCLCICFFEKVSLTCSLSCAFHAFIQHVSLFGHRRFWCLREKITLNGMTQCRTNQILAAGQSLCKVELDWITKYLIYLIIVVKQASPSTEEATFPAKWGEVIIVHLWWLKHVIVVLFSCNVYKWYWLV